MIFFKEKNFRENNQALLFEKKNNNKNNKIKIIFKKEASIFEIQKLNKLKIMISAYGSYAIKLEHFPSIKNMIKII